jgi:hypothetical protein
VSAHQCSCVVPRDGTSQECVVGGRAQCEMSSAGFVRAGDERMNTSVQCGIAD